MTRPQLAAPELLVLSTWERTTGWLLDHTAKWPKSCRFTVTQRIENLALDVLDGLVIARYRPRDRSRILESINLDLERMRFLCRVARAKGAMPASGFETAMRHFDETGRMVYGWRKSASGVGPRRPAARPSEEGDEPERGRTASATLTTP